MKVLFSHPIGNANVRAAVTAFAEHQLLYQFHTSLASFKNDWFDVVTGKLSLHALRRRMYEQVVAEYTVTHPWNEVGRLLALKAGLPKLVAHEKGRFCIDAVFRRIDKKVAAAVEQHHHKISGVYAYEDGALQTFKAAKKHQVTTLYDLPIGYWRASVEYMETEVQRWPQWRATLPALADSQEKLYCKDQELALADRIFVASNFTAKTLEKFPGQLNNVHVVPYGFPDAAPEKPLETATPGRKLRLLYVGALSQRKGLADVFEALKPFGNHIELTVIGQRPGSTCQALDQALAHCRYIPTLPHHKVLQEMRRHDVLLFPSLFEGFGLVITEAMSQGTPVITTNRTVGPDVIEHSKNGWLVPPGGINEMRVLVEQCMANATLAKDVGCQALKTAQNRPWSVYRRELIENILL